VIKLVHVNGLSLADDPRLTGVVNQHNEPMQGKFGDWEKVCWGDPAKGLLGRIPTALRLARDINADRIVWSTGATRVKRQEVEAEVLYERAFTGYKKLAEDFPEYFTSLWYTARAYRLCLQRTRVLDTQSTNTLTSLQWLAAYVRREFNAGEPIMVYSVTSANHTSRVARDIAIAFGYGTGSQPDHYWGRTTVSVVPAMTCYGEKNIHQVIVKDLGA
jgi:hypothetical protein